MYFKDEIEGVCRARFGENLAKEKSTFVNYVDDEMPFRYETVVFIGRD